MLQSSTLAQADALIGRTVTSADGKITGKVDEVRLLSDGIVAVLEGGKEIAASAPASSSRRLRSVRCDRRPAHSTARSA